MNRAAFIASRIEIAAKGIYKRRFPAAPVDEHFSWYHDFAENPNSGVHYSNVALAILDAKAALDALYPAGDKK